MGRPEIIAAARRCFSERAYEAVTLTEIARAVHIKTPSLYAHFDSKEAIYRAVFDQIVDEHTIFFTAVLNAGDDLSPKERLHHALLRIESFYRERPELVGFHLRSAVENQRARPTMQQAIRRSDLELARFVRAAYAEGVRDGSLVAIDADDFATLFGCVMDGLFLQLAYYPEAEHARLFAHTWAGLIALLEPDKGSGNVDKD